MTHELTNFVILFKKKPHKCAQEAPLASQVLENYTSIL